MSTPTTTTTAGTVLAAVAASPGATAADLADALGLGRSTVTKALAKLAQDGAVTRTPGGRDHGRRQPDRWSPPIEATRATVDAVEAAPGQTAAGSSRLGKGELRALVLTYVCDRPGEEHSTAGIARALGRSAGAVGNALTKLASDGAVTETSAAPRRYAARRA